MLLRLNQKPRDESGLGTWSSQGQGKDLPRSKTGTGRFPDFSRLSTRMVELSLEQAQRDLTLHDVAPNKVTPGSWPFLGTSSDAPNPAGPPVRNSGIAGEVAGKAAVSGTANLNPQAAYGAPREWKSPYFAVPCSWATVAIREMAEHWSGSAAIGSLRRCWKSVQKDHGFSISRTGILSHLRLAAQYTDHVGRRLAFLIGHCGRRSITTFRLLTDRIPASGKTLSRSQHLQHLKHAAQRFRMLVGRLPAGCTVIRRKFDSAKEYRCRDCGGKVGFRSRPHSLIERYVLPLFLTQAVRCTECFRRDYRLIVTKVRERPHHDETGDHIHRNAA